MNILFFGDSITYGQTDLEKGGWVNRLRLHLDENYYDYVNVFNLGISGEVSADILCRFDFECQTRYEKNEKIIIFFAVGINDTQDVGGTDRVEIAQFENNINELINKARQYTDNISLIGLTCVDETKIKNQFSHSTEIQKSYFNNKIVQFDKLIEQICNGKKVSYIKMFDLLTTSDLADGLHPNEKGHEKMFKRVLENLNLK